MAGRPWHADQDPNLSVAVLSSGRLAANVLEDLLPEACAILVLATPAGVARALRDHVAQGLDDPTAAARPPTAEPATRLVPAPANPLQAAAAVTARLRALARLGEMADRGDFDEFLGNKAAYRK